MRRTMVCILAVLFLLGLCAIVTDAKAQEEGKKAVAAAPTQAQITPKKIEVDANADGKIDRVEHYKDGKIAYVEVDTNNDGKLNEWDYYEEGLLKKIERDTRGTGKVDEWVYFEAGKPIKAERDTNGDGKPDTWVHY